MKFSVAAVVMVVVACWRCPQETHATYLTSSNQDLLSAFSWASLDLPQPGLELLTPTEGLDMTLEEAQKVAVRPRKRRQLLFDPDKEIEPIFIEVEVRFIIPLFQVFESDNLNFEVPYVYEMDWPMILRRSGDIAGAEMWQDTVGGMLRDFEDMISMFGVDGSGCVRRAFCEMATLPPLRPQGIMGEMLDVFVRGMGNTTSNSTDYDDGDLYDEGADEGEEEEIDVPETEVPQIKTNTNATDSQPEEELETDEATEEKEEEEVVTRKSPTMKTKRRKTTKGKKRPRRDGESSGTSTGSKMDYLTAGTFGKLDGDCALAFSECPVSLFEATGQI